MRVRMLGGRSEDSVSVVLRNNCDVVSEVGNWCARRALINVARPDAEELGLVSA